MKTYTRPTSILATLLGFLTLLVMVSFTNYNACAFANQNTEFIKSQTQLAIEATDFQKSKYHAYKALSGIDKTKKNFKSCGCEHATKNIAQAEQNLKQATRANSFEDSKTFLQIALKNTLISIGALEEFEKESQTQYGDNVLVLNTKQVLEEQGGVLLTSKEQLKKTMDNSLNEFENSLEKVVQHVDCTDAFNFITQIHNKTKKKLRDGSLSEAKVYYHNGVKEITYNALLRLDGCPIK